MILKAKKVIQLAITIDAITGKKKIVKTGDVLLNGDIPAGRNEKIRFEYETGTETFALFILKFTPDPGEGGNADESPFGAKVYITDDGSLEKNVRSTAKKGHYEYRLALLDSNGDLVTEDPQIIIQ